MPENCCSIQLPICHNFPICGRYRVSRREQLVEEYFDCARGTTTGLPATTSRRRSQSRSEPEGTDPRTLADAIGVSFLWTLIPAIIYGIGLPPGGSGERVGL